MPYGRNAHLLTALVKKELKENARKPTGALFSMHDEKIEAEEFADTLTATQLKLRSLQIHSQPLTRIDTYGTSTCALHGKCAAFWDRRSPVLPRENAHVATETI